MPNLSAVESCRVKFREVLEYIDIHLDQELSVEHLSSVAAYSKYHFHRRFSERFGIGVFKYVQLMRLKRASFQLAFRDVNRIVDIALASGYEGPDAFSRAFKKNVGQSPSACRTRPRWTLWHVTYRPLSALRRDHMSQKGKAEHVEIVDVEDTKVAALEYRGDVRLIWTAIRTFIDWRKRNNLPPKVSDTFNIIYDHSEGPDGGTCHYDLCAATEQEVAANPYGIVGKTIVGRRCARLRHIGSDDTLSEIISYLLSEWLPLSGMELRDFPLYLQRVTFFPDVPEHEAITDVFLPLR